MTWQRREKWTQESFYTQHVHQSLQRPRWFQATQAWCVIMTLVCDTVPVTWSSIAWFCGPHHQKRSSALADTNLPEGSWHASFKSWNFQQNISHNILEKRFKETLGWGEGCRKGVESGGGRYGKVITIGSAEILGRRRCRREGEIESPKALSSPRCKVSPSVFTFTDSNVLFLLTQIPPYPSQWHIMVNTSTPLADQKW